MANGAHSPAPRRRFAGPILLILLGIFLLFWTLGYHLPLFRWFALYWPVLIILWGLLKLLEYVQARREGAPAPGIGPGSVILLLFLILCGVTANRLLNVNWQGVRENMDFGDADFFGLLGNAYEFTDTQEQAFPAGASVNIVCPRGEVTVNTWDQDKIKLVVHKKVYASDQNAANQANAGSPPQITVADKVLTVRAFDQERIISNLEIYLPKKAALAIDARHGDVKVDQREGDVQVSAAHGNVTVSNLIGTAILNLRHGSVTANHVSGDLSVSGRVEDSNVSDIGGSASFSGDFFGDMRVAKVAKSVRFSSSRTDLEMQKLDGEMSMSGSDFQANSFSGSFRLASRSKDVRLQDFSGDVRIEDTNAEISLTPNKLPLGNIEVSNRRGKIYLALPAKAAFQVEAEATRGDISSDFDLKIDTSGKQSKTSGTVGGGGPRLHLTSDRGDIEIHKAG